MKYVMLILETQAAARLTEAEREAWMSEIMAWYDKATASGKLADGGYELQRPHTARTIRNGAVLDGPFMEAKEILAGFSVLETDTIDEAVELAQSWPGVDRGYITMEIRPPVTH